jgi:hypothetical protein
MILTSKRIAEGKKWGICTIIDVCVRRGNKVFSLLDFLDLLCDSPERKGK